MVLSLSGGVVCGRAAAALHRLDGFAEGRLEVVFERSRRRPMPRHVVVHRWRDFGEVDVAVIDAIRCTSTARTLVDLAQSMPLRHVEGALDSALRSGVTIGEIDSMIDRLWRPGRTGLGPLRDLIHDPRRSGVVPDSLFERLVERILIERGLPVPIRQFEIDVVGGKRRVDLAWPASRVAVEAHSKRWHFGQAAGGDDNARDLELAAAGWEVLYMTWKMAHEPDFFIRHLHSVVARRTPRRASGA